MQINAYIDASAPAGFAAAVQAAIAFFEKTFTNNVTMNINFNWGGTTDPNAVAESNSNYALYSYADVTAALAKADANAAADKAIIIAQTDQFTAQNKEINPIVPTGDLLLTDAQATILGLSTDNSSPNNTVSDGAITLASGNTYNFSTTGAVVAGEYSAVSAIEHEISEMMGRLMGGNNAALDDLIPTSLALFRYSAPGVVDTNANYSGGYFSLDGGKTSLQSYMGEQGGDLADWGGATSNDLVGFAGKGLSQVFTQVDMQVMEAIGWTPASELAAGSGVSLSTPTGAVGGSDKITFSVTNNGQGAAGSFTVGIYISSNTKITTSDLRIGTVTIDSLGYGQTLNETVNFSLPSWYALGAYHVGIIVDPDNQLLDSNTANNISGTANVTLTKPTFQWQDATSGNWSATGWGTGGNLAIPGAGDVADMSVKGSPYTVTVDDYTISVSGGGSETITDYAVDSVILGASTTLEIDPNSFLLETGAFNSGDILIDTTLTIGTGAANAIVTFGAESGPGIITLNDADNGTLTGKTATTTLDLHGQTIQGGGSITNMNLVVFNDSKIDATGVNNELTLNTGSEILNNGVIEATGTSGLVINSETIRQDAFVSGGLVGVINASGSAAHVALYSVQIEGGELSTSDQGVIQVLDSGTILDGSTSAGAVDNLGYVSVYNSLTLTLKGVIENSGIISLQDGGVLALDTTSEVVLTSAQGSAGGSVQLSDYPGDTIEGVGGAATTLDNVNNTISGSGGFSGLTIINETGGTIDATGATYQLVINSSDTLQNSGLVEATGAAGLNLANQTIDSKLGGHFAVGAGSQILISSDTFIGGTFTATGSGQWVLADPNNVLDGSVAGEAITNETTLTVQNSSALTLKGIIHNDGVIALQDGATLNIDPKVGVTLDGGGDVTLSDYPGDTITGTGSVAATLTNVDNTISGSGVFSGLTIVNKSGGTIDASGATYQLVINNTDKLQNSGLIEATGAAGLNISGQTIDTKLGGHFVVGDKSQILISSDTFIGGTFMATGTGQWFLADPNNVLDGSVTGEAITNQTTLTVQNSSALTLKGVIHNDGVISLLDAATLYIDPKAGVTLDGGGKVTLSDYPGDTITGTGGAAATLTNVDNTISGSGEFSGLTLINDANGVIDATGATYQLVINNSEVLENFGKIEATGAAGLLLSGQTIDSKSGGIFSVGDGSVIDIASDTFIGGTFAAAGNGKWLVADPNNVLDGSITGEAITNEATLTVQNSSALTLKGVIHNDVAIALQDGATLNIDPTKGVALDGHGNVTLSDYPGDTITGTGSVTATLTNVDNTISGSGVFSDLTIVNETGGVIDATGATYQLVINNTDTLQNSGLVEATGAAGLNISGQTIDTKLGGHFVVGDKSQIVISSDTFIGGTFSATGSGQWVLGDGNNVLDGSVTGEAITNQTTLTVQSSSALTLKGVIHNDGVIALQDAATLNIDPTKGVTLDGGGKVTLSDYPGDTITGTGSVAATLTNVDNTISGSGVFSGLTIVNKSGGTIDATGASYQLVINSTDTLQNGGLIEATGAAGLNISGITVTNAGGTISAGAGSKVVLTSDLITFGTLQTTGTGIIEIADSGTTLSASNVNNGLTLAGTIQVDDGQLLSIVGSVVNSGKIEVGVASGATLQLGATLSGGGSIVLMDSASNAITVGFNNVDNTISGAGTISAHIQQQSGGVIEATHLDNALILSTGAAIQNAGVLEANAGNLVVEDAVTGAGNVVITNGGTASFASTFDENVNFIGASAGALDLTDAYTGTIAGFGIGDSIELLGLSAADSVKLNTSDQLVVKSGTTIVATLQLTGNYGGDLFLTETNASGVEIVQLVTPTVAVYLANKAFYDGLSGGFEIVDTAAAIQANLVALGSDASVLKIMASSGIVTVSVSAFKSGKTGLDKVAGGFAISDTASNIVAGLSALATDAANIQSISVTGAALAVTTLQFDTYRALLDMIPGGYAISDTAAQIQSDLSALQADAAHLHAITATSGSVTVSATDFLSNKAALDKVTGGFTLSDTAANLLTNIVAIAADAPHVASLKISGATLAVSASQAVTYHALLDKIPGGFAISDTAANIQTNLTALLADVANIASISSTTGDVGVSDAAFKADRTLLDKITPGVTVNDTATAILADLSGLAADTHVDKVVVSSGAVSVSVATFTTGKTALDKIVSGFAISDSAGVILANLDALLADVAHIHSVSLTNGTITVNTTQFNTYQALLNALTTGYAVADTAANVLNALTALQARSNNITGITLTSGSLIVSSSQFAANEVVLNKIAGGFSITDTAANIVANLDAIAGDASQILSVNVTGSVVVSAAQAVKDRTTLDKIGGGFTVSDTAANIQANLASLLADNTHIVAITSTSGDVTVSDATFTADRAFLDKITTGFVVSDTAAALLADFAALAADGHISKIVSTSGAVTVSVSAFQLQQAVLDKVSGGFVISDTSANILAALSALNADAPHIQSIVLTSGAVTVSIAQFIANSAVYGKIIGGFTVSDTAANIQNNLAALEAVATSISAIKLTSGSLTVTAAVFAANRAALDKVVGNFAISDTSTNFVANLASINADLAHIKRLTVSGKVVVSASQAANNKAALDKLAAGYAISDTAANIQAALASLVGDTAKIVSITSTNGNVTVTDAVFEADRALLNKVTPGIVISDLGAKIVADLANLSTENAHIAGLLATDGPISVGFAKFKLYASLLNKTSYGFGISDLAATITANFAAIAADSHIASIVSTNGPLKFSAAAFVANEATINKVVGGVAISDTTAHIVASAQSLLGDFNGIQSIFFTDAGTPTLKLTALQVELAQSILNKVANNYVLDETISPGITIATGHGNSLTIADVPTDDTITGGGTSETFVFGNHFGHATLTDFYSHTSGATTHDTIKLSLADFGTWTTLSTSEASDHVTGQETDVWLTSKLTGDTLVIDNLTKATLGTLSTDFKLA